MRNLALRGLCGADGAALNQSNQFLPVTRPLSATGERERCSVLTQGGDASAWPLFCWIVVYKDRVDQRNTETHEEIRNAKTPPNEAARPFRTTGPDGRGDRGRSPRFT